MLANRIPHVSQSNIYESTDDEQIHHLSNINSVPLHLTQMESQHPTTSTMSHQYSSNLKGNGGENEFVDINDMNFMEHRREIDHENLLVRRSQRKIKKDEECKWELEVSFEFRRKIYFYFNSLQWSLAINKFHFAHFAPCQLPTCTSMGMERTVSHLTEIMSFQFLCSKLISRCDSLREKGNSTENQIWTGRRWHATFNWRRSAEEAFHTTTISDWRIDIHWHIQWT